MGTQSLAVACGALALCLTLAGATNPGFVVRITQAGLDYAHKQGLAILEKKLANEKLQDISNDTNINILGEVHYELSGLDLQSFHLRDSRISLVPKVGLQVSISNAFAALHGNWLVKKKIQANGSFDVKFEDVNIKVNLKLGNDASGKPTIDTSYCSTNISKVQVRFSGKIGQLYNLLYSVIESRVRKILENKTCDIVVNSVSSHLQPYVQTFPVTAKLDAIAGVDYSLVGPPTATTESLDVAMKGECYSLAKRSTFPFSPPMLTLPPDHDRMVYFGVSSYFFNTASFVYHKAGALNFEISESTLQEVYPGLRMKFKIFTPSAPFLNISSGSLSVKPVVDIQAYIILPNSSLAPLFRLSLTGKISAVISVKSGHIIGKLTMDGMKLSLKHSDVGDFQVEPLQSVMNIFASSILVPHVNEWLGQGLPLPMPKGIELSNILVQFHQNLLLLGANVQYQPQA